MSVLTSWNSEVNAATAAALSSGVVADPCEWPMEGNLLEGLDHEAIPAEAMGHRIAKHLYPAEASELRLEPRRVVVYDGEARNPRAAEAVGLFEEMAVGQVEVEFLGFGIGCGDQR